MTDRDYRAEKAIGLDPGTRTGPCKACGGDKGFDVPYNIDRRDGSLITYWQHCVRCDATGDEEYELEEIELEDLEAAYG